MVGRGASPRLRGRFRPGDARGPNSGYGCRAEAGLPGPRLWHEYREARPDQPHHRPEEEGRGQKKSIEELAEEEEPKVRICEICRTASPLDAPRMPRMRESPGQGTRTPTAKLVTAAADVDILMTDEEYLDKTTIWVDVDRVRYARHHKEGQARQRPGRISVRDDGVQGMVLACSTRATPRRRPPSGGRNEEASRWRPSRRRWMTPSSSTSRPASGVRKKDKLFEVIDHDFETGAPTTRRACCRRLKP